MTNPSISFGIWVGGNVTDVTIANLTIRDIYYHPIIFSTWIEYRFPNSTGVQITNDLLDGRILARDGATARSAGT
jgi:hypothetical protein